MRVSLHQSFCLTPAFQVDIWGKPKGSLQHDSKGEEIKETHQALSSVYKHLDFAFLKQVHGDRSLFIDDSYLSPKSLFWGEGDAAFSCRENIALSVRVADCIPIVFCAEKPLPFFGVVHAGWRGLRSGVLSSTMRHLKKNIFVKDLFQIRFWVGPHIGVNSYEVGEDVFGLFPPAFLKSSPKPGKKYLDLKGVLSKEFADLQIEGPQIVWNSEDTYTSQNYYSHRRGDIGRNMIVVYKK